MKKISLFAGGVLIVDDIDYELLKDYRWTYNKKIQSNNKTYYTIYTRFKNGKRISINKILFNNQNYTYIKHINGNPFDYRRENIIINDYTHKHYRERFKSSSYIGVTFHPDRDTLKWSTMISKGKTIKYSHYFDLEIKAAIAYNILAEMIYGNTAKLNQIMSEDYDRYYEEVIQYIEASRKEKSSISMQGFQRKKEDTTSRYVGVYWGKSSSKWCCAIEKDGKRYYLGSYEKEIDAALAYNEKAIELYGSLARINTIDVDEADLINRKFWKERGKTSRYIGVAWNKASGKWAAGITCNKKRYFIGYFSDEISAAKAYDLKAAELLGEKAKLNGV